MNRIPYSNLCSAYSTCRWPTPSVVFSCWFFSQSNAPAGLGKRTSTPDASPRTPSPLRVNPTANYDYKRRANPSFRFAFRATCRRASSGRPRLRTPNFGRRLRFGGRALCSVWNPPLQRRASRGGTPDCARGPCRYYILPGIAVEYTRVNPYIILA